MLAAGAHHGQSGLGSGSAGGVRRTAGGGAVRGQQGVGAEPGGGSIDGSGCLVWPWQRSAYDVGAGRMVRGPQGIFARVPGLDFGYRMLTRVLPLGRAPVTEHDGDLYVGG